MVLEFLLTLIGFVPVFQDTLSLKEVEVYAPEIDRFAQGQKIEKFEGKDLQNYQARSLGDLLQERSPLFIRQYGPGMLASPSFRGTSAGHTAVFWNGLPINSPSLGQSDLALLPVQAIDEVQLQYGSNGALFGNEAIGGSVHLGTISSFGKGLSAKVDLSVGSFGLFNTGVSTGYSNKKISTNSRFYRFKIENDFKYNDLGQPGTPEVRQDHAAVNQQGFVQDFAWNLKSNQQVKVSYWWNQTDREIQPVMGSNTADTQEDINHRLMVDYFLFGKKSTLNFKGGAIWDKQYFNQGLNETRLLFFSGDWDYALNPKWNVKAGLRVSSAEGDLSTYSATDRRLEAYQSVRFLASNALSFSANFREIAYEGGDLPFVPSAGMDWRFWQSNSSVMTLKLSGGRGFKIPTLNDRFWDPGGNPDLLPEESVNGELGLSFSKSANLDWKATATYYHMMVENWIIWLPQGSFWSPTNIREVRNQGLEMDFQLAGNLGSLPWEFNANYAYSSAIPLEDFNMDPGEERGQLPYTPEHQGNFSLRVEPGNWYGFFQGNYVGKRSISTSADRILSSYQIFNVGLGHKGLKVDKVSIPFSFQINNLFNTDYQVLYLRAMPGISYQLNLSITL